MAYQLQGSYKKVDTDAFDSYLASSMGKSSPKEQEWRQVFIEARERPFTILWEESRTILTYKDFNSSCRREYWDYGRETWISWISR